MQIRGFTRTSTNCYSHHQSKVRSGLILRIRKMDASLLSIGGIVCDEDNRVPSSGDRDDKCEKSSLHHISGAAFTDPCPLGCGVHHKYIDCAQFQEKHPSQRRDHIMATERCFSCFGRHKSHECQKQKHCTECGGRHHMMLSCVMNRRLTSPNQSVSPLNPSSVFTPHAGNENSTTQRQGFLCHVNGLQAPQQLSPTTYVEVRDANGAWHQVAAFFDSGSDTTLIKSSLAQR